MLTAARRGVPTGGAAARNLAERWAAGGAVAVGSEAALARLGLAPGERLTADALERVLRGRHSGTDTAARGVAQLGRETLAWLDAGDRPPRRATGVVHLEVGFDAPRGSPAGTDASAPAVQRALLEGVVAGAERLLADGERPGIAAVARIDAVDGPEGRGLRAAALLVGVERGKELLASPSPARGRLPDDLLREASASATATYGATLDRAAGARREAAPPAVDAPAADAPAAEPPARELHDSAGTAAAPAAGPAAPAREAGAGDPGAERRVRYLQRHLAGRSDGFVRVELLLREAAADSGDRAQRVAALRREHQRRGLEPLRGAKAGLADYRDLLGERATRLIEERAGMLGARLGDRARDRAWLADTRDRLGDPLRGLADAAAASEVDPALGRDRLVEWWRGGAADRTARALAVEGQLRTLDREAELARQAQAGRDAPGRGGGPEGVAERRERRTAEAGASAERGRAQSRSGPESPGFG